MLSVGAQRPEASNPFVGEITGGCEPLNRGGGIRQEQCVLLRLGHLSSPFHLKSFICIYIITNFKELGRCTQNAQGSVN